MPSLISGRIYIFDVESNPRAPQIHKVLYQSNQSFNIPPFGQTPGHLNFWTISVKSPPPPGTDQKLFKCPIILWAIFQVIKCPHLQESYQITVLTFQ